MVREQYPDATVQVLDSWETAVTAPVEAIRAQLGLTAEQRPGSVGLVGHSVGGLAAIEWALTHPDELGAVVLLDPTTPSCRDARSALPRRGHPSRRASGPRERSPALALRGGDEAGTRVAPSGLVLRDETDRPAARRRSRAPLRHSRGVAAAHRAVRAELGAGRACH
ncbi:alpha/beta fold hydrolase [Oerskovia sp. M15]